MDARIKTLATLLARRLTSLDAPTKLTATRVAINLQVSVEDAQRVLRELTRRGTAEQQHGAWIADPRLIKETTND